MNVVTVEAKTKEEAKLKALEQFNNPENDIIFNYEEVKGGLFKGITCICNAYLKSDILNEAVDYLKGILDGMRIESHIEISTKDNTTTFKMYTNRNEVIIGKEGKNLEALTIIVRQFIKNITSYHINVVLDVEDYKDRQLKKLERLAKNLAREVLKTKVDVEMDNMNSYERRIVHNALSEFKNIKTESVGEEPNRHIVIKYTEI